MENGLETYFTIPPLLNRIYYKFKANLWFAFSFAQKTL